MKNIAAILISACMLCSAALPAFAFGWKKEVEPDTYQGKVITMEAQEGEYGIENSAGRALTLREGSKLYNGYEVYTEDGYVWVALDENGVLKMDLDTEIKIEKNGKDLEIILIEGEIFFNITEDFKEDETFTISTSTMTTGIRGTSGIVSTKTRKNSVTEFEIKLLEGSVELGYAVENVSDTHLAQELTSGRTFWLTSDEENAIEEDYQSHIGDLEANDVNGFVAVEIENSSELQEKILSAEGVIDDLVMEDIVAGAQDKLAQDEAARDQENDGFAKDKQDAYDTLEPLAQPDAAEPSPSPSPSAIIATATPSPVATAAPTVTATPEVVVTPAPVPTETPEPTPTEIAITYSYNGEVFATQTAMTDEAPVRPYLQPTAHGRWFIAGEEYTFETLLTADTEIVWQPDPV